MECPGSIIRTIQRKATTGFSRYRMLSTRTKVASQFLIHTELSFSYTKQKEFLAQWIIPAGARILVDLRSLLGL